jgi:hypothetical protein
MKSFWGFLRWATIGSLALGGFAFICLYLFVDSLPGSEGSGLLAFIAMLVWLLFTAAGFVIGGIYGVARARKAPLLPIIGWSAAGAFLVGVLTPEISVWRKTWWDNGNVLYLAACGAVFGSLLGAACGIIRAGLNTPMRNATEGKAQ